MGADDRDLTERQEQLGEILADWLEAEERGRVPARQEWLARHAEFAPELQEFLADTERFQGLAVPLREVARAAHVAFAFQPPRPPTAPPPGPLGDYELLEEIGQGGMGVVYRARQRSLGRLVALKMVRPGPGDRAADLQRFRNEAELVAQLDHPHVVPIYEVGEHEGCVYFTMKLVEGGGLDTWLADFAADPRAAARLLVPVARAVHHAHQRGILHRDLKPSNVLLDRAGQPHITDFGLAKRVEGDTVLTQSGVLVGTPAYMAPEQATGQRGGVTTAADVYGLGAILYALLTGRPPFQGASLLDTLERVKGRAPEPPGRLNPRVARDLETVCLRCLHKDPHRRYESAAALADDLERWLRGEPILARPVGRLESFWRWCRRQPVQAALGAALLLAVVLGVSLVVWQWQRAEENYRAAEKSRQEAEENARVAEVHRRAAVAREAEVEDSFRLAHEAVKDFTTRVSQSGQLEAHGLDPLHRDLLQKAQAYYEKFLKRRRHDPALRRELAEATVRLADIIRDTGPPEKALTPYRRVLALCQELVRADPRSPLLRRNEALLHSRIAAVFHVLGRRGDALDSSLRAKAVLEDALRTWPEDESLEAELAGTYHNLGTTLGGENRVGAGLAAFAQARARYEKLLRGRPDDPDLQAKLAHTHNNLGMLLGNHDRWDEALEAHRKAASLRGQLAHRFPGDRGLQLALAESLWNLGNCSRERGQPGESVKPLAEAQGILERLVRARPHMIPYRVQLGLNSAALGLGRLAKNDPGALDSLEQARQIFQKLTRQQPNSPAHQLRLEKVLRDTARAHSRLGQDIQAVQVFEAASAVADGLARRYPNQPGHASRLAAILHSHAETLARLGRLEEARSSVRRAVAHQRRALEKAPKEAREPRQLAGHYTLLAAVERALGRPDEAVQATQKRLDLLPDDANELYLAARDLGLTAAAPKGEPAARSRAAGLAVDALRRAVAAGFRDAERARTDPALAPVRARPEFQQLLLDMGKAPGSPSAPPGP
jgi:tetratricopeptide (TPR) repeat protein